MPRAASALRSRLGGLAFLVLIYCAVVYLIPRPASVKPEGWRLTGIFIATIAGSILQPVPGGVLVLAAIALVPFTGGLTIAQALAGFGDPVVWLVMAAFFISRALIKTGLARRIALFFVRLFGRSSLGISYALTLSDLVLASVIPSNGARSGGVILPIARSIAELYGSAPGPTADRIGNFLLTAVYQGICITTAMFITGQASNALGAQIAASQLGVPVTWASWFVAGIVPGMVSIAVIPWLVLKLNPPTIVRTPEASRFAQSELSAMGRMSRHEKILAVVFVAVCGFWVTTGIHGADVTVVALLGSVALVLAGVLDWDDLKNERAAWEMLVWYGGVVRLGRALSDAGVTAAFAHGVAAAFGGFGWVPLLAVALAVYFYAHYGFASITAHLLSMFPPFALVLIASGAPRGLVAYSFLCLTNLAAGLTHYGTTPSPLFFAQGYIPMATWWKVGLAVSVVNLLIWSTVGFTWWRIIGFW